MTKDKNETVVLLHGIMRTGMSMYVLEQALKRDGYDVINKTYPSTKMSLKDITIHLQQELSLEPKFNSAAKVHFVTHSMGGIVTRYFLGQHKPDNMGRVVMLGPPNKGSEFADFLTDNRHLKPVFDLVYGPAGEQMCTNYEHDDTASDIDYEVGIIAGSASINPLSLLVLTDEHGEHDGIVPVANTVLDKMTDHIVITATHSFMMNNRQAIKEIKEFLKNGKFSPNATRLTL